MFVTDDVMKHLIRKAFESMSEPHRSAVRNVAIVLEDEPSPKQRKEMKLRCDQTLLGLYTGVPLTARHGQNNVYPPDVITLFKQPLLTGCETEAELYENIRHTLWHELAHYFGLDHKQINDLE